MKHKLIVSAVVGVLAMAGSATGVALAAGSPTAVKAGKLPGVALMTDRHHHHCDGDHDGDDRACRRHHHHCHYPPSQANLQLAVTYVNGHAVYSGRERCDRDGAPGDTVTISLSSGHGSCTATSATGAYTCTVTATARRLTAQTHSASGASSNMVAVRASTGRQT